jgi:hypothetical protein
MRWGVLRVGAGAAVVVAAASAAAYGLSGGGAASAVAGQALRTSDGSAGCVIDRGSVTCSNDEAQRRARPVVLQAGGTTSPRARLMALDWSSAPVLRAGQRRTIGSVRCVAVSRQLMCYTADGSGLSVSATQMSAVDAGAHYP